MEYTVHDGKGEVGQAGAGAPWGVWGVCPCQRGARGLVTFQHVRRGLWGPLQSMPDVDPPTPHQAWAHQAMLVRHLLITLPHLLRV